MRVVYDTGIFGGANAENFPNQIEKCIDKYNELVI
jgi:hypothetical protein